MATHSLAHLFGGGLFLFPRKEVSKMMKVRILDRCEVCDGEESLREERRLTAIGLAKCAKVVVINRLGIL
jgi:hypothetical protein